MACRVEQPWGLNSNELWWDRALSSGWSAKWLPCIQQPMKVVCVVHLLKSRVLLRVESETLRLAWHEAEEHFDMSRKSMHRGKCRWHLAVLDALCPTWVQLRHHRAGRGMCGDRAGRLSPCLIQLFTHRNHHSHLLLKSQITWCFWFCCWHRLTAYP